jgi:hypothetical protein
MLQLLGRLLDGLLAIGNIYSDFGCSEVQAYGVEQDIAMRCSSCNVFFVLCYVTRRALFAVLPVNLDLMKLVDFADTAGMRLLQVRTAECGVCIVFMWLCVMSWTGWYSC